MLRRVATAFRRGLLAIGLAALLWLPVSWFYAVGCYWPQISIAAESSGGGLRAQAHLRPYPRLMLVPGPYFERATPEDLAFNDAILPRFVWYNKAPMKTLTVSLPLWLLAFICLAWPATSFLIARRRHKRGFPIEPKGGGEAVPPPVSSS